MSLSWLWQQQGKRDEARELLARRLPTILPPMTLAEAVETTRIHRVADLTGDRTAPVTNRPFRAPHQAIRPYTNNHVTSRKVATHGRDQHP
jgi:predicted ATPase with chaperone activity